LPCHFITLSSQRCRGARLGIVFHQRLAAGIGAGHHQCNLRGFLPPARAFRLAEQFMKQQMMQRRIGQHQTDAGQAGGDTLQLDLASRGLAQQYDGAFGRLQQRRILFAKLRVVPRRKRIQHHYRERFFLALFAAAQSGYRCGIARIAHQMETAHAFDGDNLSSLDEFGGGGNGIVCCDGLPLRIEQT